MLLFLGHEIGGIPDVHQKWYGFQQLLLAENCFCTMLKCSYYLFYLFHLIPCLLRGQSCLKVAYIVKMLTQ